MTSKQAHVASASKQNELQNNMYVGKTHVSFLNRKEGDSKHACLRNRQHRQPGLATHASVIGLVAARMHYCTFQVKKKMRGKRENGKCGCGEFGVEKTHGWLVGAGGDAGLPGVSTDGAGACWRVGLTPAYTSTLCKSEPNGS